MKSGFRILLSNAKSETNVTSEKSIPRVDCNEEIRIRIAWISFLLFDWETRKRICKTILLKSGLLFANYPCMSKTAVLKNSFSKPFSDFRKKKTKQNKKQNKIKHKKKGKERKSKERYLSFETRFQMLCSIAKTEIRIFKPKSRFPNHPTHPRYSCLVFWNLRHWG